MIERCIVQAERRECEERSKKRIRPLLRSFVQRGAAKESQASSARVARVVNDSLEYSSTRRKVQVWSERGKISNASGKSQSRFGRRFITFSSVAT